MIRKKLHNLRLRYRRWRLLRAYSKVFKARTGKSVGFTPTMAAWTRAERDGVLTVEDDEIKWNWPDETKDRGLSEYDLEDLVWELREQGVSFQKITLALPRDIKKVRELYENSKFNE